jgi:hypothetical protein
VNLLAKVAHKDGEEASMIATRWLAALCLLVLAGQAYAGPAEDRYFALRDSGIKKFSSSARGEEDDFKQHEAAVKELAGALRALVGDVKIKSLPGEGTSNIDTLDKRDSGFGHLDGLAYASENDKTQVVVTTAALVRHWLRERREDGLPQDIAAAVKSSELYYLAVDDAAYAKYAELPITRPAGAQSAVALLGVRGNGDLKGAPNEIDIAVLQGERIILVVATVEMKTAVIPACEKVWTTMMAKPIPKGDPRADLKHEDQAMAAFTACFAREAPNQRWFAAVTAKAQGLIGTYVP